MENNNHFDELIVSYLSRELNAEEEAFVLDWINSSEEHKQYFEALRSTWSLLAAKQTVKDINIDSEWNQFKQIIGAKQLIHLPIEENGAQTYSSEEAQPKGRSKLRKLLVPVVIAASAICLFSAGWLLVGTNSATNKHPARKLTEVIPAESPMVQHRNTTMKPEHLVLQDGTAVVLYDKSEISYHQPFMANKRDIVLTGAADFTVAKDKTRPFTVFSGDVSTTALGTHFKVTALRNESNIFVTLYEGKVLVRSRNPVNTSPDQDFYLHPGEELVYNRISFTASVKNFWNEGGNLARVNKRKGNAGYDNPSLPHAGKGTWYMFNNQPLNLVFDQLESMFNVDIVYSKKEVSKIYFIGTFGVSDSIEVILTQITKMNNLRVTRNNNRFIITK
jgi:transmembrane sensor